MSRDDAWRKAEPLAVEESEHNLYKLMPGGHLLTFDLATGEEKYTTTIHFCTCPAGEFRKECRHLKMLWKLTGE